MAKTKSKITAKQAKILASLESIRGMDAVKIAADQILKALGESPVDLLLAKAAQYTEMADLIKACNTGESESDADEDSDADEASEADEESDADEEDDDEEEDEEKVKASKKK